VDFVSWLLTLAEQLTHSTTCLSITDRGKKHGIGAHKRLDSACNREDAPKTLSEISYTTASDFSQDREDKMQRVLIYQAFPDLVV